MEVKIIDRREAIGVEVACRSTIHLVVFDEDPAAINLTILYNENAV